MEKKFERSNKTRRTLGFGRIYQSSREFNLDSDTIKEQREKE